MFHQDNAPIYTSAQSISWLSSHSDRMLPWLAELPDMNIIGNVWGILARRVCRREKKFNDLDEVEEAVRECWFMISADLL